jgi:hypothetical protein
VGIIDRGQRGPQAFMRDRKIVLGRSQGAQTI